MFIFIVHNRDTHNGITHQRWLVGWERSRCVAQKQLHAKGKNDTHWRREQKWAPIQPTFSCVVERTLVNKLKREKSSMCIIRFCCGRAFCAIRLNELAAGEEILRETVLLNGGAYQYMAQFTA